MYTVLPTMDRKPWIILVSAPDDEDNTETRWAIKDKGVKNALESVVNKLVNT
jgi:hypothetical protein